MEENQVIKLDIGCGPNPKEGYIGCDIIPFNESVKVFHAGRDTWPFEDESVEEVHASHFLEHLTNLNEAWERTHFFNEANRVLVKSGKISLVFPHWASQRYYGDPTHKEPFSEFGFYYLDKEWRKTQAPHADIEFNPNGYSCDFTSTWGYGLRPDIQTRNMEYQQYAMQNFKEVLTDIIATCIKK
jgi:hypothetical protein